MKKLLLGFTLLSALTACPTTTGGTGSANLTFSGAGGYNGSTATLSSSSTTLAGVIMIAGTGTGANERSLSAFLPRESREAGTTYVIKDINGVGVLYQEGNGSDGKLWAVTGGSIRVAVKSGKTLTFELINVTLGKKMGDTTPSAGTVTVNGTMTGESITPL